MAFYERIYTTENSLLTAEILHEARVGGLFMKIGFGRQPGGAT